MQCSSYKDHGSTYSVLCSNGMFGVFHRDGDRLMWSCNIEPFTCHPLLYKDAFIVPRQEFLWGTTFTWKDTQIDVPVRKITHIFLSDGQLGVLDAHGRKHTFPLSQ